MARLAPVDSLRCLDLGNGDLAGTAVRFGLEADLLAVTKAANSGPLEGRRVDEDVLVAVVRLNEAEGLLVVVDLYCAGNHGIAPSLAWARERVPSKRPPGCRCFGEKSDARQAVQAKRPD